VLAAAQRSGAEIFAGQVVEGIWREGGRCAGLRPRGENAAAKWTVVAAGAFSSQIDGAQAYAPVRPAKGQILALRVDGLEMERVLWSDKIYLVPRNDGRTVAGATVEYVGFEKGVTAGVVETWSGLRPDSPDHLPILGPTDVDGLLMATGHFRSGVLLTPITARLMREWITLQRVSLDWDRFSPLRFVQERQSKTA